MFFILSRETTPRNDFVGVINRSYDGGIKDSPTSPGESHDVSPAPPPPLPPRAAAERAWNVSREVRVVERVNPHHEVELLYGNITLIRRLMNDGPSSVRVPRLNLIRALNLPGREHDGIPCRSCVRQRRLTVAVTALAQGGLGPRGVGVGEGR